MPPMRGIGAGVDGEEQAVVAQVLVQRLAGHAGLDHAVEVLGVHGQHAVHARGVDRDAAVGGVDVALQRRAGAVGDDRARDGTAQSFTTSATSAVLNGGRRRRRAPRCAHLRAGVGVLVEDRLRLREKRLPNRSASAASTDSTASAGGLRAATWAARAASWISMACSRCFLVESPSTPQPHQREEPGGGDPPPLDEFDVGGGGEPVAEHREGELRMPAE